MTNLKVWEIIAMREMHNHVFGLSNIYFVCLLAATPGASAFPLHPCTHELEDAKWIPLDEFEKFGYYAPGTLYHEIGLSSSRSARRLIEKEDSINNNNRAEAMMMHRVLPVDEKASRMEALWMMMQ